MLIAESGATKTEWRLINRTEVIMTFRTLGFNPNVMAPEHIQEELNVIRQKHLSHIDFNQMVFYGAGLKDSSMSGLMKDMLSQSFPGKKITVFHDLQAAVHSTGFEEGIVCIMGTGSNSCYYKGGEIVQQRGGHGYLLGDEGSGADLGHALVKGLLEGDLPVGVKNFIEFQEGGEIGDIRLAIYRDPKPNVRMARFAKYLDEVIHYPEIQELVKNRFLAFLDSTVCKYENYQQLPVTFVGSISFYFQEWLLQACKEREVGHAHIMHDPIEKVVAYHQSKWKVSPSPENEPNTV